MAAVDRAELLDEAERLVNGVRDEDYGDPADDFGRTALMWAGYLGIDIEAHDVAAMMCMVKLSRIRETPGKRDSWVDVAGYAACGWSILADEDDGEVD